MNTSSYININTYKNIKILNNGIYIDNIINI